MTRSDDAEYQLSQSLIELRRQDEVIASLQAALQCDRRGICLMHEWLRRYGTPGGGCRCFNRFFEHVCRGDFPD